MLPTFRGVSIRSNRFVWGGFTLLFAVGCETFAPPPGPLGGDVFTPMVEPTLASTVPVATALPPPPQVTKFCGDGVLDVGEACDDGNGYSGDGCNAVCTEEPDFNCLPFAFGGCVYTGVCGDGVLASREACDQGLGVSNDGCDDQCRWLPGWDCSNSAAPCKPLCGDGLLTGGETCDDRNAVSSDGCSRDCRLELGFECDSIGAACRPTYCGDGVQEGSEVCDDANAESGDGCSNDCQRELDCRLGPDACVSPCGDGLMLPGGGEGCDDGNGRAGDGCSPTCQLEPGFDCWPPPPEATETPNDAGPPHDASPPVNDAAVSPDAGTVNDTGVEPLNDSGLPSAVIDAAVPPDAEPTTFLDGAALNLVLGADASVVAPPPGAVGPSVCLPQAP
jgi:cysteine-rich repeat protein